MTLMPWFTPTRSEHNGKDSCVWGSQGYIILYSSACVKSLTQCKSVLPRTDAVTPVWGPRGCATHSARVSLRQHVVISSSLAVCGGGGKDWLETAPTTPMTPTLTLHTLPPPPSAANVEAHWGLWHHHYEGYQGSFVSVALADSRVGWFMCIQTLVINVIFLIYVIECFLSDQSPGVQLWYCSGTGDWRLINIYLSIYLSICLFIYEMEKMSLSCSSTSQIKCNVTKVYEFNTNRV